MARLYKMPEHRRIPEPTSFATTMNLPQVPSFVAAGNSDTRTANYTPHDAQREGSGRKATGTRVPYAYIRSLPESNLANLSLPGNEPLSNESLQDLVVYGLSVGALSYRVKTDYLGNWVVITRPLAPGHHDARLTVMGQGGKIREISGGCITIEGTGAGRACLIGYAQPGSSISVHLGEEIFSLLTDSRGLWSLVPADSAQTARLKRITVTDADNNFVMLRL